MPIKEPPGNIGNLLVVKSVVREWVFQEVRMVGALPQIHEPALHAHIDVSVCAFGSVLGILDGSLFLFLLIDQVLAILVDLGQTLDVLVQFFLGHALFFQENLSSEENIKDIKK